jgi:tetratricopeptide (TPR) repeat protein
VNLSSYDTREWFVVLFIPIIPLRQKRIIDFCPSCTRHHPMSLKKYLKAKNEDYAEAMEKYDANPNDSEAVAGLLGIFGAYQDMESFEALKNEAESEFAGDSTVQVAIGFVYYNYGDMEPARTYFEKSLTLKDDEDVHEALGFVYLRLSEPDKTAEHFRHIIEKHIVDKTGYLFALVDGYQAKGRHQNAIELMDAVIGIDSSIAKDKNYKKTRKLSEKNLDSCKPTKNRHFVRDAGSGAGQTPVNSKKALGITAAVVLLIFLIYAGVSFYVGKNANVYLVNGLARSYEVVLDGQTYSMPQSAYKKIKLSEGTKELTVSGANISIDSEVIELRSSFWKRPFLDRIYVMNPDTVALLQWTKMYYAEPVSRAPEGEWKPYAGQMLYVFDGIDFPFKRLPDEVSISGSGPVSRIQVSMVDESEIPREQFPSVIEHYFGFEAKINYLKKCLYYEPDGMDYLYSLYAQTDPGTFIETVYPGLDAMPVRIEWHRLYQSTQESSRPEYDLRSEYQQRLDKSPDSSELRYLYGRVLNDDRQQALHWFKKAVEVSEPCGYGYYALGYHAMVMADFKNALSYFEKALKIEPDNPFFCDLYYEMLVANNQLGKACDYCGQQMTQKSDSYMWMQEHVDMLLQLDRNEEADRAFEQWCRGNKDVYSAEAFETLRRSNQLSSIYRDGDFDAIRRFIGEPNQIEDQVLLTLNNRETISDELMAQADSFLPMWKLLFYISESQLGNEDNATLFLAEAIKQLKSGGYDQKYAADCLGMEKQIDEQKICCLAMEVPLKAVTLTALGIKFPEHRERFWELADQLNYKKVFPYHFLNSIFEEYSKQAHSNTETKAKQI